MKKLMSHVISLEVTCSDEMEAELQRLFRAIAGGVSETEQRRIEETRTLPAGYVRLANGNLAPTESVKEQDELEDAMVCDLHALMSGLIAGIEHVNGRVREDGAAFLDVLKTKYNVTRRGVSTKAAGKADENAQPQMTLMSLDGSMKVVFDRDTRVSFGPDVVHAKELVFKYIADKSKGANQVLVDLAHQAFSNNKDGYIPVGKVAALWRVKCNDPDWTAAMTALKDALRPDGTRDYVRFYERDEDSGEWVLIRASV